MNTNLDINKLLEDLFMLDPALRSEEAELREIIEKLIKQKPEAEPDEEFRLRLKAELLDKVAEKNQESRRSGFFIIHRKAIVGAAGIAAALVVVLTIAVRPGLLSDIMSPVRMAATEEAFEGGYEESAEPIQRDTAVNEKAAETPAPGAEAEAPASPAVSSVPEPSVERSETAKREAYQPDRLSEKQLAPSEDMLDSEQRAVSRKMDTAGMLEESEAPFGEADYGGEEYKSIFENGFIRAAEVPLSTFSIDVDTASYSNVRRFINSGILPNPDAVRIEELINYFDYDYPQPENGRPFSFTTELSECPWNSDHRLLHIGLQGYEVRPEELPRTNIVFLIDSSGSMQDENKLPLLKESVSLLVDTLRPEDRVSIVAYAGSAGLVLPPTAGNRKVKILRALDKLEAGGSTAGGAGIDLAYRTAAENLFDDGNNRVILATDGDFNVGQSSEEELKSMIEDRRDQGIFLTVLGLGMGNYKDARMEALADNGNGNYAYIDTINEAKKVLITEFSSTLFTIAKDVKIQIDFDPVAVDSYRLIGYENRVMAAEDFDDDRKDAGEIGAGHSVTALYEIVPAADAVLGEIKFRYKNPDEDQSLLIKSVIDGRMSDFSDASDNFRFAAAVAEWGMLLRGSVYAGTADIDRTIIQAKQALGQDPYGYRREFVELLLKTKELMY